MRLNCKLLMCFAVIVIIGLLSCALANTPEPLPSPGLTIADTQAAGRDLKVTITPVEEARSYELTLYRETDGNQTQVWNEYVNSYSSPALTVPGHALEAGSYRLKVEAYPYNYGQYQPVTVERIIIITGLRPEPPVISLANDTAPMIKQMVFLSVDRPFQGYAATVMKNDNEMSYYTDVMDGHIIYYNGFTEPGDYTFRVTLQQDGVWSSWSAPLEIHIGSMGTLEAPAFVSVPEKIEAGSDFTVEITPVSGADYYKYSFARSGFGSSRPFYAGRRATISDEDFSHTTLGIYTLTCTPYTDAPYEARSATATIEVVEANPAPGPSVTLEATSYRVGDAAIVMVAVPGAQGLRLKLGSNSASYNSASDCYRVPVKLEQAGEISVSASVKLNGAWTAYGESMILKVDSSGALDAPVITLSDGYRGLENEPLSLHVDTDPRTEYTEVRIARVVRYGRSNLGTATTLGNGDYTFPGTDLLACDYQINATCSAYGMESGSATLDFTVAGTVEGTPPVVTLKNTDVTTGQVAVFMIEAPGATQVRMRYDNTLDIASGNSSSSGASSSSNVLPVNTSSKVWQVKNGKAMISWLVSSMYYRFSALADGKWGPWSEPIYIENSGNSSTLIISDLPRPQITLSADAVKAGDPLTMTVAPTGYSAIGEVRTASCGSSLGWASSRPSGPQLSEGAVLDIDTSALSVGAYMVVLRAYADDGRTNTASAYFEILEGGIIPPKPTLTVTADRTEIYSGEMVNFTLTSSGEIGVISAIEPYAAGFTGSSSSASVNYGYSTVPSDTPNVRHFSQAFTGSRRIAVSFQAYIDGIQSDMSNPIIITVKGNKPDGDKVFPVLEFNLSADTVATGNMITASWDSLEGAQSYSVEVYADRTGVNASLRGTVTDTYYTIDTHGLPAGCYTVSVKPMGAGYTTQSDFCVSRSFVVVTRADADAVLALPDNLSIIGDEAFEGIAAKGIILPQHCTDIGNRAFSNCPNLVEVHIPSDTRNIADDAFRNSNSVVIYCPSGSIAENYALSHGIAVVIE